MAVSREGVRAVARVVEKFDRPWWIAGGWAIDLFLGKETREHDDVEIALYREDQLRLQECFADWQWTKLIPREIGGGEVAWDRGERLKLPVHQVHAKKQDSVPVELAFLLNESREDLWVYRRDTSIARLKSLVTMRTAEGIPFLSPEVQLLFKSKQTRCKDSQDFQHAVDLLEPERRDWLRRALAVTDDGHPWLRKLS